MVQKIGNALLCIFMPWLCTAALDLSIENTQGIPLLSVGLGASFAIVVKSNDGDELRDWPTIEGLSKFRVVGQRSDMNMVMNGTTNAQQKRFIYNVIADTPGTFTLGPAHADSAASGTRDIVVLDARQARKNTYPEPVYECILDKQSGVVGEKIPFTLRVTFQDPDLNLVNLAEPQVLGLRKGFLDEGTARAKLIDNQLFSTIEYKGYMYPERAGVFAIPRLRAEYTQKVNDRSGLGWGFFGFGALAQKRSIFSQPGSLHVDEVPTTKPVQAVGTFTDFTASLSTSRIPQGEAAVLTFSLKGEGDMERIQPPALTMPDALRHYESKSSVVAQGSSAIKTWEYIVQGLKEGSYQIKEQTFMYFDTVTRSVKTLKSKPLTITIDPGTTITASDENVQEKATQPLPVNPVPSIPNVANKKLYRSWRGSF